METCLVKHDGESMTIPADRSFLVAILALAAHYSNELTAVWGYYHLTAALTPSAVKASLTIRPSLQRAATSGLLNNANALW